MGKFYEEITEPLRQFIENQHVFFVATAAPASRINLSPKGLDTLRILDSTTVAYLDLTGSGNETAAHLRADGRMTMMFCAFDGKPTILRLYGVGEIVGLDSPRGIQLADLFREFPGARQFVLLQVSSLMTSCGFGIPIMDYRGDRDMLPEWATKKGEEALVEYRRTKNAVSIDGLPAGAVE
jgi:hypothetical protein